MNRIGFYHIISNNYLLERIYKLCLRKPRTNQINKPINSFDAIKIQIFSLNLSSNVHENRLDFFVNIQKPLIRIIRAK